MSLNPLARCFPEMIKCRTRLPECFHFVLKTSLVVISTIAVSVDIASCEQDEEVFAPCQSELPAVPPQDAIVLFANEPTGDFLSMGGEELNWRVEDGALVSRANGRRSNHAISRLHFRDADIHVEFKLPKETDGNSGVYLQGLYEIQILNSWGKEALGDGEMGAVYGIKPPLTNASRPPGKWQVLDVRFRAPRRDGEGKILTSGSLSAWLNGQLIHDRVPLGDPNSKYNPYVYDTTPYLQEIWKKYKQSLLGPLVLQDHESPVCFRNVWVKLLND